MCREMDRKNCENLGNHIPLGIIAGLLKTWMESLNYGIKYTSYKDFECFAKGVAFFSFACFYFCFVLFLPEAN